MRGIAFGIPLVLLVMGCATTPVPRVELPAFPPDEDAVAIVAVRPLPPAALQPGDRLEFDLVYQLSSAERATLYVRPYTDGRQSRNYMGHAPIECQPGLAKVHAWISFRGPAAIDEVRVMLIGTERRELLAVVTNRIDAVWEVASE